MADVKKQYKPRQPQGSAAEQRESSYRLARLLRSGSRELARQLNVKRAKKNR